MASFQHREKPPVQCFHGGQSYKSCPNFKCDFSVTVNVSGPSHIATEAMLREFQWIDHYPEQYSWTARCHLAEWIDLPPDQVLLGNGASEFIDLIPRLFKPGQTFRTGPYPCQFMEYRRSALNRGLVETSKNDKTANVIFLVNPNSPTGDFIVPGDLRNMINESESVFVVDESFLMCIGEQWMKYSAMNLIEEFGDRVIVISSWTKVLACPMLRIGSVVSTRNVISKISKFQIPWSVNGLAQTFFISALHDEGYFEEMWRVIPTWKQVFHDLLKEIGLKPNTKSPLWVPFVFVDMLTEEIASEAEKIAFDEGFPIRNCASFGLPKFVRLSVRKPVFTRQLVSIWKSSEKLMKMIEEARAD